MKTTISTVNIEVKQLKTLRYFNKGVNSTNLEKSSVLWTKVKGTHILSPRYTLEENVPLLVLEICFLSRKTSFLEASQEVGKHPPVISSHSHYMPQWQRAHYLRSCLFQGTSSYPHLLLSEAGLWRLTHFGLTVLAPELPSRFATALSEPYFSLAFDYAQSCYKVFFLFLLYLLVPKEHCIS